MRERIETGPMSMQGDWPGIFIRGDDALQFAWVLGVLLNAANMRAGQGRMPESEAGLWLSVQRLLELLDSCRTSAVPSPDSQ